MARLLRGIEVLFTGPVYAREKLALYDACTAFCLPSVYEPFGIVALEAMARSKPVIFSSSCGVGEIVPAGAGIRVDYADPGMRAQRLAEGLGSIFTRDLHAMGRQARELALQYRWSEQARAYVDVIEGVSRNGE